MPRQIPVCKYLRQERLGYGNVRSQKSLASLLAMEPRLVERLLHKHQSGFSRVSNSFLLALPVDVSSGGGVIDIRFLCASRTR